VEKHLPQNIEAECGVLGSIIIDPEAIVQVADFLHNEDFYRDAHRTIYETIIQLYEQHEPADFITICDELERQNKLETIGGASYITSLVNMVPTSGNVEYYGRIVERTAILRRLIQAAGDIAAIAYQESDAEVALDKAEQLIFNISQNHSRSDFSSLGEIITGYMEKLEQLHERRGTIIGVPTGFSDLDRLTGGLQRSDLIILAARPAVGKCLTAKTLIDNPETGERLTLEECISQRMATIHGLSEDGAIRVTEIADWVDSGIQPCFRVKTHLGRMIEVTGHHPFLTVRGWIPLHDLHIGDHIAVPTKVECFGKDDSMPLDKVRLLAYFIAEGGLTHVYPVFTNTDPIIVEDFKQSVATHFPACAIKQYGINYAVSQPRNAESQRNGAILPKNPATLWLTELGLMGKLAKNKYFPACVWKWSRRSLAEFLRALMSCDGSIYLHSHGAPVIKFTVASNQLAADVYHAFTRFGITSRYYQKSQHSWRVIITNPASVKRYQEEIGWIGEKADRFAQYEHSISARFLQYPETDRRNEEHPVPPPLHPSASYFISCIPPKSSGNPPDYALKETWMIIRADVERQGLSLSKLAYNSGQTTKQGKYAGYHAHTTQSISRTRLSAFADALDNPALRRIASPDIYWDKIIAIEPIGEHQVYDLTVPDGANFIAQDIFVHNTSFALSLAHNAAVKHQQTVAIFSLEMSKEQLIQRFISMNAGIDQQRLRTGWIEDDEWDHIIESMEKLADANIWIDDTASISTMEVRSKARRLLSEHGVDLIIIDYLQLMQSNIGGKRNENRVQEVSEISRSLKGLARELNVPVLALAQLSRTVESRQSKVPQLSDLRESGCLAGETPVYLPDEGIYRPIEQLAGKSGFRVLALNTETWQLEPSTVTKAFSTGRKPVYTMRSRLGRNIRATANHKFLTIQGWKRLDELMKGERIALPKQSFLGNAYCGTALYKQNLSRERAARLAQVVLSTDLSKFANSDVYWDEVVAIEPDGDTEVYDLTVEGLHNFIASDFIVHNSIEQDADIVMFIYRDEVYNPETERKNIADIIVAKHRNGPTGEISLFFQASQTRFADLEVSPPAEE
jgi:replicative DNA helicase